MKGAAAILDTQRRLGTVRILSFLSSSVEGFLESLRAAEEVYI